jgi:hypothetical protein
VACKVPHRFEGVRIEVTAPEPSVLPPGVEMIHVGAFWQLLASRESVMIAEQFIHVLLELHG